MSNRYFSGQGRVMLAQRDASGNALQFSDLGNVKELSISIKTDVLEHKESTTGQRGTDLRLQTGKAASVKLVPDNFDMATLALVLYGAKAAINSGSVTNEICPATLAVGDYWCLLNGKVSSVVITDSAGSPGTLTANTHYSVDDARFGTLKILNLGSFTQPFKAAYSKGAAVNVNMLTQAAPERWLRFEGINTADNNNPVLVDLYRMSFDPIADLGLLNSALAEFSLSGSVLADSTKAGDTTLGQYGRIRDLS